MKRAILVLAVLLASVAFSSPAYAQNGVQVSEDGKNWSKSVHEPLFDSPILWIPGDSERRSFWVRNTGTLHGAWTLDVRGLDSSLFETGDVLVKIRTDNGSWQIIEQDTESLGGALPIGSKVKFDADITFSESSTNMSQLGTLPLSFDFEVTQDTPSTSRTDKSVTSMMFYLGPFLMLGGIIVAVLRKKNDEEMGEEHDNEVE